MESVLLETTRMGLLECGGLAAEILTAILPVGWEW